MSRTATKPTASKNNRVRVQACFPLDVYENFKACHSKYPRMSESAFASALIESSLQATTTEACVNSTQASA